ncbi:MAG: SpoIIE family protein phosphatase [Spirochaetes bacterium]|nr:SpoIIE family protein phosphatase [Spirochaetota bacterium]
MLKLYPLLCILALSSCMGIISSTSDLPPRAFDGIINLTEWDFSTKGFVELNGIWKLYPHSIEMQHAQFDQNESSWYNIEVPGYWNSVTKRGEGIGWYRLRVKVADSFWRLRPCVYVKGVNTAYELYVNEIQIMGAGVVGENRDDSTPSLLPRYAMLPNLKKNEFVIAIKVSNFFHRGGGLNKPIVLGTQQAIQHSLWKMDFFSALVLGFILMMAMYHGILWLKRKEDVASIWFSMFCFVILLHTLAIDNYFERIFPNFNIFELRFKVEYISLALSWTTFAIFIHNLYPNEMGKRYVTILVAAGTCLAMLPFVTNVRFYSRFVMAYNCVLIGSGLWTIGKIIVAIFRKREDAMLVLLGFFVLMLTVINDILHNHHVIHTFFMSQFGLGGFLFFQSVILSMRFARAYQTAEYLSQSLHIEVQRKTEELRLKTEAALNAKEEIEQSMRKIEALNVRMAKELELAKRVHDRIIPKEILPREFLAIYIESRPYMVVGGDYYDVTDIGKTKTRIFLADAMGHGVSASLMTMLIKSEYDKIKFESPTPVEIFLKMNDFFVENYKALRTFFTGIIIDVDVSSKRFTFASAGHHEQFFIAQKRLIPLTRTGRAIGISKDSHYEMAEFQYCRGDKLFLFTDGVFEEFNLKREEFGIDRLEKFVLEHCAHEAKSFCDELINAVTGHISEDQMNDDLTFIIVELL